MRQPTVNRLNGRGPPESFGNNATRAPRQESGTSLVSTIRRQTDANADQKPSGGSFDRPPVGPGGLAHHRLSNAPQLVTSAVETHRVLRHRRHTLKDSVDGIEVRLNQVGRGLTPGSYRGLHWQAARLPETREPTLKHPPESILIVSPGASPETARLLLFAGVGARLGETTEG